ncbi:MAG: septal ring lytic transglycosylase RlpA family protein [Limnobacter sp.]|nr:septal ring lytic transglycosylase RlpA family protein [Limnobacter sp.]
MRALLAVLVLLGLSACSSVPIQNKPSQPSSPSSRVEEVKDYSEWEKAPQGSGYYLDDGPGSHRPVGLADLPDAIPAVEPIAAPNKRTYTVMGQTFHPQQTLEEPYRQKGHASWYGRKFHGAKTANGEIYDMYQMTAAHPTLPLPSYARVTNLSNNKQVIVRVNDRGPFLRGRIIDLSYAAALKLDYINQGSAEVLVEKLTPELIAQFNANRGAVASAKTQVQSEGVAVASPVQRTPEEVLYGTDRAVLDPLARSQPIDEQSLPGQASPIGSASTSVQVLTASIDAASGTAPKVAPKLVTPIFLQIGAFGSADNAKSLGTQLRVDFPDFASMIEVVESEGLHRVVAGPFASQEAANEAAIGFSAQAGLTPVVKEGLNLQ